MHLFKEGEALQPWNVILLNNYLGHSPRKNVQLLHVVTVQLRVVLGLITEPWNQKGHLIHSSYIVLEPIIAIKWKKSPFLFYLWKMYEPK